ncbi:MAG: hypothetical protein C0467_11945 [Planctomycetaceae bacterium]|nr:hypothetical protein [Planctomycetaceae bacterium]
MDIDREGVEVAVRDYVRQYGRFDSVEVVLDIHEINDANSDAIIEGWQVTVKPSLAYLRGLSSYFRRRRSQPTMALFVDHADGRIHQIPSAGLRGLIAQLRGRL